MSSPTQVIKFAGIHDEPVGSLGAQALGEWEGLPFFMSSDQRSWQLHR